MRKLTLAFFACMFSLFSVYSQLKGSVKDDFGVQIPGVNIYIPDSPYGTTSNEDGIYTLDIKRPGTYVVHFQFIGYKSQTRKIDYTGQALELNVLLPEEFFQLNEVVISKGEDPAYEIIRQAIKHRQQNGAKIKHYTADFYSRGVISVDDLPKTFLGEKIDYSEMLLDSTGSGMVYLSETVSKLHYAHPVLREQVTASLVSGNNSGYSFNTALAVDFDFYNSAVNFPGVPVISPIGSTAFLYYKFELEGSFMDEYQQMVNKIRVISKRKNEPTVDGFIYIVDDSWAIYGVDFAIKGENIKSPGIENFYLKQNFLYNPSQKVWVKGTQLMNADVKVMIFKAKVNFVYVFSNYNLAETEPLYWKKNELVKILDDSNTKDSTFWALERKVPLTSEEVTDYRKKDSVRVLRTDPVYLDSIQRKRNQFKLGSVLNYTYTDLKNNWRYNHSLIKGITFNAVQGLALEPSVSFAKIDEQERRIWDVQTQFNYGIDEKRLRIKGEFRSKYNSHTMQSWTIAGGSELAQFNSEPPISNFLNAAASLLFKDNYIKLYERNFVQASYAREWFNGFYGGLRLAYNDRQAVDLNSDFSFFNKEDVYHSNNPLDDTNYSQPGFDNHQNIMANWGFRLRFGQKLYTHPEGTGRITNSKYPEIQVRVWHTLWANQSQYEFLRYELQATQSFELGAFGNLSTLGLLGDMDAKQGVGFMDYKHFNGNQTHVDLTGKINTFGLLPYYARSTTQGYGEAHLVYSDYGFFANKIPVIKWLKPHVVAEYHLSAIDNQQPYHEFQLGLSQLGFGLFKKLQVKYVYAQSGSYSENGVLFGFKMAL